MLKDGTFPVIMEHLVYYCFLFHIWIPQIISVSSFIIGLRCTAIEIFDILKIGQIDFVGPFQFVFQVKEHGDLHFVSKRGIISTRFSKFITNNNKTYLHSFCNKCQNAIAEIKIF